MNNSYFLMKKGVAILVILIILLAIAAGFLIFNKHSGNAISNPPGNNNTNNNDNNGGNNGNQNNNTVVTPKTYSVDISGFAFSPSTLTIKSGDSVTWTNHDSTSHTVTSDTGSELSSQQIPNGETYSHTFNTAGTYSYHCSIHPSMKGKVIVQ
jgi:amicyanin